MAAHGIAESTASLQELATALGITKRAAEFRAKTGCWPYTEATVRGGSRRLYPLDGLPQPVRDAVDALRAADVAKAAEDNLEGWAQARQLRLSPGQIEDPDTWKKLHCYRVLKECPAYSRGGDGRVAQARRLAQTYGITEVTIWRWEKEVEGWQLPSSAPRLVVGRESIPLPTTRKFDEPAVRFGLQTYGQNIRRGAKWAYTQLQAQAAREGWEIGDYSNFTRLLKQVPDAVWDACRRGMVAVERDYVPKVTRAWLDVPAYTILCGDQNVDDCRALDPVTGEILTMNDYLWMDCTSRAWVGMWPSFGPYNRYTVAYALRMACEAALPDQIYTDWGGPETSKNTAELVLGLRRFCQVGSFIELAQLYQDIDPDALEEGPTHRKARAGIPWHKPIENQMNLYRRYRLDDAVPGFRQRAAEAWENKAIQTEAKRQERSGELWTLEQHLEWRMAVMQRHNAKQMQVREGGGTFIIPGAVLRDGLAAQPGRTRVDGQTLDLLFLPRREITPRQSSVSVKFPDGTRVYKAMELSRLKRGERITVHADPFDGDRPALISRDGEFICHAERQKDINPVTRDGLADAIAEQRRMLKWWRDEVRRIAGLPVGDRGLVRIGQASQLARRAEEDLASRKTMQDDRERAGAKIIQLAQKRQ